MIQIGTTINCQQHGMVMNFHSQAPLPYKELHIIVIASYEISAQSLRYFLNKGERVQRTHKLCLIMLINPIEYGILEKHYFSSSNNYI